MSLPALTDGVLPEGIHICFLDEVAQAFGRFQRTERRQQLTAKLRDYLEAVRQTGTATAVIVDGSYVTAKEEPGDIDVLLVLKAEVNLIEEMRPAEYNIQSKRMVKRLFGFDIFTAIEGTEHYAATVDFLLDVKATEPAPYTSHTRKGIVRIEL
jgi:hypothetical protein